ncbi:Ceramidase [Tranquillimonas rosea]|uniref:Ceramidase n=1 Tax=Tranquillimonas rosea TaxID=641238 RepID=A0A1H9VUF5_9RHOB|nr:ceramidase domain-containing protein [Tranquillimonas rosea]SES25222.1 Ceramidase [Tranquillimonas rosea]
MDWTTYIDGYCERTDPGYWAEPVNAVTNAAFLLAAAFTWRRSSGLILARLLCVLLFAIGIGSYLFHTHATVWASTADTTPIGLFILLYLFAANLHFWTLPGWAAALGTAAFVPWTMVLTPLFAAMPFFTISSFYWPVPLLIALYAVALHRRAPQTARGLAIGAAILVVSLTFRSLDEPLCGAVPVGTHFLWHVLNATMLGWMIEVYRRHMLEAGRAGR